MTKLTAVGPKGDCPRFKRFLKTIFDGDVEMISYMQRVIGYALTGDTSEHALFFCYGTGADQRVVCSSARYAGCLATIIRLRCSRPLPRARAASNRLGNAGWSSPRHLY